MSFLRRQFLQDGGLPFGDVLSRKIVTQALTAINVRWLNRIYSPLVTLWVCLSQVLYPDQSCRAAVARLNAHRLSRRQRPCSARTGAYCQAKRRLPEEFFARVARKTGSALDSKVDSKWLWKGRRVYIYDGSTVLMPDTVENQLVYPQVYNQKAGVGFPIARIAAVFSLACGAVLDLGICRYAGKGQSETGLLRKLWSLFRPGDVVLGDRLLCSWMEIATLQARGIDCVCRLNNNRKADFRRGKRLSSNDHMVFWPKPARRRAWDQKIYDSLPGFLMIRECRVRIDQPGFRTKSLVIVTTLLDNTTFTKSDLVQLYRARWNAELDLRSLKATLQMDMLRSKRPEQVRKEIWTHILAYNLIRTIMAQAAVRYDLEPRSISFKGTIQTLEAFRPFLAVAERDARLRQHLCRELLKAIADHRVATQPNRFEPRQKKRRKLRYNFLMVPRWEAKGAILRGTFIEN
jgi:hypothetical protein